MSYFPSLVPLWEKTWTARSKSSEVLPPRKAKSKAFPVSVPFGAADTDQLTVTLDSRLAEIIQIFDNPPPEDETPASQHQSIEESESAPTPDIPVGGLPPSLAASGGSFHFMQEDELEANPELSQSVVEQQEWVQVHEIEIETPNVEVTETTEVHVNGNVAIEETTVVTTTAEVCPSLPCFFFSIGMVEFSFADSGRWRAELGGRGRRGSSPNCRPPSQVWQHTRRNHTGAANACTRYACGQFRTIEQRSCRGRRWLCLSSAGSRLKRSGRLSRR